MPAGKYDALNIKIGKANGHNWWCSLFPALCFTNVSNGMISKEAKNILKENLGDEELNILVGKAPKIKLKFKLIELINK